MTYFIHIKLTKVHGWKGKGKEKGEDRGSTGTLRGGEEGEKAHIKRRLDLMKRYILLERLINVRPLFLTA